MDRLVIRGGNQLKGSVQIHGAKNAALPQIAAALLSAEPLEIGNVPDLLDVTTMLGLMQELGVTSERRAADNLLLDPRGARLIKDVFRKMSERGVGILMSTHTLEVAQEMCDRISIILKGKIIARGTVSEIRSMGEKDDDQLTSVFLKLTGHSIRD